MNTLVVYDSLFGNTEKVAQAIAASLGGQASRVGDVRPEHLRGLGLLVVGTPTHGFRPSPATKEWLKTVPRHGLDGTKVAAFDTRILPSDVNSRALTFFVKLFGYAAEPLGRKLAKAGGTLVVPPEGFAVTGREGPLKAGELERAGAWGRKIAASAGEAAKAER